MFRRAPLPTATTAAARPEAAPAPRAAVPAIAPASASTFRIGALPLLPPAPADAPAQLRRRRRKGSSNPRVNRKNLRLAKMLGQTQKQQAELPYDVVDVSHTRDPLGPEEAHDLKAQWVGADDKRLPRGQVPEGELGLDKDDIGYVDPHRLRLMHQGIDERFSDGKKIADTANVLRSGALTTDKIPPTALFTMRERELAWNREDPLAPRNMMQTGVYSADHRRVLAHRLADKPIRYRLGNAEEEGTIRGKYTTRSQGLSLEVRAYHEQAEGAHQRSNKSTRGRYRLNPDYEPDIERDNDARAQFKELPEPGHKNRLPALYQFIKHFGETPTGRKAAQEAAQLRRGK